MCPRSHFQHALCLPSSFRIRASIFKITYKALCDLLPRPPRPICPPTLMSSLTIPLLLGPSAPARLASLWFLEGTRSIPASGPLHLLIILFFPVYLPSLSFTLFMSFQILTLSPLSRLCSLGGYSLYIYHPPPYPNGLWGCTAFLAHL